MRFSANLGLLFRDRTFPEAIRAAAEQGFDAVECHWPFEHDPRAVRAVLAETGLPLLGLNTVRGDAEAGEFGLAAVPGREEEARAAIEQAVDYAARAGCRNIHVMAGRAEGRRGFETFVANLKEAARLAEPRGVGLLIEPLNTVDTPGYFLTDIVTAARVVEAVGSPALRIMFDCYHMQIMRGDLLNTVRHYLPIIGHIQFAGVPNRDEPDRGEVNYPWLLPAIEQLGYDGFFGAEYRPVSEDFAWM